MRVRRRVGLALVLAALVAVASPPAHADDEEASLDEALGGFDDADEDLEDALSGFDDEDVDDVLGGFDDPSPAADDTAPSGPGPQWIDQYLDVSGSMSLGASYNVIPHFSSVGPDPTSPRGTYFGNLQRLRWRGDVQADLALPRDWKLRVQAFGYYDLAFLIHGRDSYTQQVLEDYELQGEVLDLFVEGGVGPYLDLKLGRQVVNWGRSDTLRVTDVLNALNNREPGLVDIEDLRLPSTMAKADVYLGRWSLTALVVPEIRYDYDPVPGSDFFPAADLSDIPPPPPGFPFTREQLAVLLAAGFGGGLSNEPPSARVPRWGALPEYGFALTGIFSGWDISFYVARVYQNRTTTIINLPAGGPPGIFTDDDRVTMVGGGGNYTVGSWLFKAEVAWFDELDFAFLRANPAWMPGDPVLSGYTTSQERFSRLDWMAGVEYYGFTDVTIALEVVHRHVFDYVDELQYLPNYVFENSVETALRVTSEHLNARLTLTGLGLVIVNEAGLLGATMRLSADYDLRDALVLTGGYLHFFGADQVPFDTWQHNDRLFAKIKYSF